MHDSSLPVNNIVSMTVVDTRDDLLEEVPRLILQLAPLLNDVVKQLASLAGKAGEARGGGRQGV